jgi:hypothetical protein
MHFALLVVGNNPIDQVKPFYCDYSPEELFENGYGEWDDHGTLEEVEAEFRERRREWEEKFGDEVDEWTITEWIDDEKVERVEKRPRIEGYPETVEAYIEWEDWIIDKESGRVGRWHNPNGKVDGWGIGGRYHGLFINKQGHEVDFTLKREVDWDAMVARRDKNFEEDWERIQEMASRTSFDQKKTDEITRRLLDLKEGETKDERRERTAPLCTYAVLKDGKWDERGYGKDGYEDEDVWNKRFMEHWDSIPDDALVTIIDCHS